MSNQSVVAALIQRVTAVTEEMDLAMRIAIASGKAVPSQKIAGWLSSLRVGLRAAGEQR